MMTKQQIINELATALSVRNNNSVERLLFQLFRTSSILNQFTRAELSKVTKKYLGFINANQTLSNLVQSANVTHMRYVLNEKFSGFNTSQKDEFLIELFQQKTTLLFALHPKDILLLLSKYSTLVYDHKRVLLFLFNRFSEHTRNQAILEYFDNKIFLAYEINNNLPPAIEKWSHIANTTDLKFALRAVATHQINPKIFHLLKNKNNLNPEQLELVRLWEILNKNQSLRNEVLSKDMKSLAAAYESNQNANSTTGDEIDPTFFTKDTCKKSRKPEADKLTPEESILNTPHGAYKILDQKPIGFGQFGKVKIGINLLTGEKVAIKIFTYDEEDIGIQESAQACVNNLKRINKLKDEVIVDGRGKDRNQTKHYVIMDYVPGKRLLDVLFYKHEDGSKLKKHAISFSRKLRLARSLTQSLNFYHDQDVIFCDIKPENCLVDKDDNVELVDFDSISFADDPITRIPTQTQEYKAPEVHPTTKTTFASDIYAQGAVFGDIFTDEDHGKPIPIKHDVTEKILGYIYDHTNNYLLQKTEVSTAYEADMQKLCKNMMGAQNNRPNNIKEVLKTLNEITKKHYDAMKKELGLSEKASLQTVYEMIHKIDELLNPLAPDYYDELSRLIAIIEFSQLEPNPENLSRLSRLAEKLVKKNPVDLNRKSLAQYFYDLKEDMFAELIQSIPSKKSYAGLHDTLLTFKKTLDSNNENYHEELDTLIEIAHLSANKPGKYDSSFWNDYYALAKKLDERKPSSQERKKLAHVIQDVRFQAAMKRIGASHITPQNLPISAPLDIAHNTSAASTKQDSFAVSPSDIKKVKENLNPDALHYHRELGTLVEIAEQTTALSENETSAFLEQYYQLIKNQYRLSENDKETNLGKAKKTINKQIQKKNQKKTLSIRMMNESHNKIMSLLEQYSQHGTSLSQSNIFICNAISNIVDTHHPEIKQKLLEVALASVALLQNPNNKNLKIYQGLQSEIALNSAIREADRLTLIQEMQKLNAENIKIIAKYEAAMKKLSASNDDHAKAIHQKITDIMIRKAKKINQQPDGFFRKHFFPSSDLTLFTQIAEKTLMIVDKTPQISDIAEYAKLATIVNSKYELYGGKNLAYIMICIIFIAMLAFFGAATGGFGLIPAVALLAKLGPLICGLTGTGTAIIGGLTARNVYKKLDNEKFLTPLYEKIMTKVPKNNSAVDKIYKLQS